MRAERGKPTADRLTTQRLQGLARPLQLCSCVGSLGSPTSMPTGFTALRAIAMHGPKPWQAWT